MKREKRPGEGRPSKYDPKYCDEIIKFFDVPHSERVIASRATGKNDYEKIEYKVVGCSLPFFSGFAHKIGVATMTIQEWSKVHPEFSCAYARAKELQHIMLHENTLKGLYNPHYAIFAAKNITDWRDKVEIEHGLTDETFEKYRQASVDDL